MARRLEPGWNFSTLYLIKDSLAIMLEAAGLLEDAFREYFELEACYLEALKQGGNLAGRHFGGSLCIHAHLCFLHAWPTVCAPYCRVNIYRPVLGSVCTCTTSHCWHCTRSKHINGSWVMCCSAVHSHQPAW